MLLSIAYPLLTYLSKQLDGYVALSASTKQYYVAYGFDAHKIEVIPNFFSPPINKRFDRTDDSFTILYVGRIIQEKGVDVLINAFSRIVSRNQKIKLVIVGDGEEIITLKKLVQKLELTNQVVFTGFVDGTKRFDYYSKADVFVHPANWPEPFGRSLLEAMSFDVPVIVSDVGAPPEIVGDAGLVFKSNDVEDLKCKLELLLYDQNLLCKLKNNCSRNLDNYSPDLVMKKIFTLYKKLLVKTFS